mgnify:CR=1 FL=1
MSAVIKKATNLSIRSDLLAEAKSLHVNLSAEFEKSLVEVVRRKREEQWLLENREAIAASNRFVAEHGVFGEEFRQW